MNLHKTRQKDCRGSSQSGDFLSYWPRNACLDGAANDTTTGSATRFLHVIIQICWRWRGYGTIILFISSVAFYPPSRQLTPPAGPASEVWSFFSLLPSSLARFLFHGSWILILLWIRPSCCTSHCIEHTSSSIRCTDNNKHNEYRRVLHREWDRSHRSE